MTLLDLELLLGFSVLLLVSAFAFGIIQSKVDLKKRAERVEAKRAKIRELAMTAPLELRRF